MSDTSSRLALESLKNPSWREMWLQWSSQRPKEISNGTVVSIMEFGHSQTCIQVSYSCVTLCKFPHP